jgi:hypothetical protein
MSTFVTINLIAGQPPFYIYICDNPLDSTPPMCIYVDTISTFPYEFEIPSLIDFQPSFRLKVIDNNGCESFKILT